MNRYKVTKTHGWNKNVFVTADNVEVKMSGALIFTLKTGEIIEDQILGPRPSVKIDVIFASGYWLICELQETKTTPRD